MKKHILALFVFTLIIQISSISQSLNLSALLEKTNQLGLMHFQNQVSTIDTAAASSQQSLIPLFNLQKNVTTTVFNQNSNPKNYDTLYIGTGIQDSLYITGNYSYQGTIMVLNQGRLIFENAQATIQGDIIIWGNDPKVEIRNSSFQMPQNYIYERSIIVAGNGKFIVENSSLNFSGFSHNLVITDSAYVKMHNLQKYGFTTCGLSAKARIDFELCNEAEFVITDQSTVNINRSNYVLLWHHIPSLAHFEFEFPNGDSIQSMSFSDALTGIQNIDYQYSIIETSEVMWGLMPEPESTVLINNSTLRTIGVWFKDNTEINVSGLVNNSQYTNFTAPLSNHNLQLNNSFVQTWSLYLFEEAHGTIQNCIVGEIGAFANNQFTLNNSIIDGSGGYLFLEQTANANFIFSNINCDFHTNDFAAGVMAYGNQNFGRSIAKDKSIMIFAQSNLMQFPEIYNDAMVWYLKLEGNTILEKSENTAVLGSAWIQKASSFYPTDLAWYELHYRKLETDLWIPICRVENQQKFSEVLHHWDTQNIDEGTYTVKLSMCDNSIDSNKVEAFRQYIISNTAKIESINNIEFSIFPNPAKSGTIINIQIPEYNTISKIECRNLLGIKQTMSLLPFEKTNSLYKLNTQHLPSGTYFFTIYFKHCIKTTKVVIL